MLKLRQEYPRESAGRNERVILILFFISIFFYTLARIIPDGSSAALKRDMLKASQIMAAATDTLKECRRVLGLRTDLESDVNDTGLIGVEHSVITTSVGHLEAKRTSANPNFAGLIVKLLYACDVKRGDAIAVGASGSFPALILATLSAAKAMEVRPLVISSLGASQWGGNNPRFHWLKIGDCLAEHNVLPVRPIAVTLGGERDTGEDMDERGRTLLLEEIRKSAISFLSEPDLIENVRLRMNLYKQSAGGRKIKAFVNVGGSWANMGTDSSVLHLKPGLNEIKSLPALENRGMISAMAAENIPVIHLLFVRGLARDYGLPWDPVPLPRPGEGELYTSLNERQASFMSLAVLYLALVFLVIIFRKRTPFEILFLLW